VYGRGGQDAPIQVASKEVTWRSYNEHEADRERRFEMFATVKGVYGW